MMKRAISVGFSALLMLSALVVMDIVPVMNVSANDPFDMGGGLYITAGDWTVDITSTLTSFGVGDTVVVNGDLTITPGYSLTFIGANLQMNCPSDGAYTITVQSSVGTGGTITIQDFDGNPLTTGDRSVVNSSTPDGAHRFNFIVEGPRGQIDMRNSELRDCGWEENWVNDYQSSGLWIGTDISGNAPIIKGNEIHECVIGVTLYESYSGADISNNDFHDCSFTGVELNKTDDAVVNGNTFTTCGNSSGWSFSLHGFTNTNAQILNNVVEQAQYFPIFLSGQTDMTVSGNTVRDSPGAGASIVIVVLSGTNFITNNEVYNVSWHGLFVDTLEGLTSVAYIFNNSVYNIIPNIETPLFRSGQVGMVNQNLEHGTAYIHDNTVDNIDEIGTNYDQTVGITVSGGSGHSLLRNTVSDISDWGISIGSSDVTIDDCEVFSCGDGDSEWDMDSGIYVGGDNTTIKNSRIYDNYLVSGHLYDLQGVMMHYVSNTWIHDTEISGSEINIRGYGNIDALIENCTITNGPRTNYNFDLDQNSDITVLSPDTSTWDNSSTLTNLNNDLTSTLALKWWLDVQVTQGGSGVNGVDVWVNSSADGQPDPSGGVQPFVTQNEGGQDGWVKWIPVTEYTETTDGTTQSQNFYTPHWVNATTADSEGYKIPNMWQDQGIEVPLNVIPEVDNLLTQGGVSSVLRDSSIFILANAHDGEDSEGALTAYFQYRVNDTAPWVTTYFQGASSYNGAEHAIEFKPPIDAPLGDYDFRVRVKDTYGSYSPWYPTNPDNNLVEVKNNPPTVESTSNEATQVYRGDIIYIKAIGDDVEDQPGDLDCEIQYRPPGTTNWYGPDTTLSDVVYSAGGHTADFSPRASPTKDPIGFYDFKFRFQDTDGAWTQPWEEQLDWIEVLNNLPKADNIYAGSSYVYRNAQGDESNFVWLFANVTEKEDPEDSMSPVFEYVEYGKPGWQTGYIDDMSLVYDYAAGLWKVKFIPPYTAAPGSYDFKVTFTDLDGGSGFVTSSGLIQVMNNLPTAIDITPSVGEIRAGIVDTKIFVNAADVENAESALSITGIQYQYDGPNGGVYPGEAGWKSSWAWFDDSGYDPGEGALWVEFEPPEDASPGYYGFRVKVGDLNGGESEMWLELLDAIVVKSPKPEIEYVTAQADDVFRGATLTVRMSGSDAVDAEEDLVPLLQYRKQGGTWLDFTGSTSWKDDDWELYWIPAVSLETGRYELQGRFQSKDGKYYSDYMAGTSKSGNTYVTVKNNIPTANEIGVKDSVTSVDRMDTITLWAKGDDGETPKNQLTAYFQYAAPGDTWSLDYFTNKDYNELENRWEIDFKPDDKADLGDYSFQVYFKDGDGASSDPIGLSNTIKVNNVKPIAGSLIIPSSGYRGETIQITASGTDPDGNDGALTPTFEYKHTSGTWTPVPGTANYVGTSFRISWTPGANEKPGMYSFQVRFSDDKDDSDWLVETDAFELKNNEPEVEIESPQRDGATVTFSASASDPEGDVTYEWDFGDGSDTSSEENPSHTYSKSGSYIVKVTVTDENGDSTTDTYPITIPGDVTEGGLDFLTLLLLIIVIVVVVLLLLVLLMGKRKKKPEEAIPPAAPPAAPMAPEAPLAAAPAAAPPAAPMAVPMAAPAAAAAPAAVPAAAPAAAPQKIKCPKCGTAFEEARTERPITIQCPNCGAKGTLR